MTRHKINVDASACPALSLAIISLAVGAEVMLSVLPVVTSCDRWVSSKEADMSVTCQREVVLNFGEIRFPANRKRMCSFNLTEKQPNYRDIIIWLQGNHTIMVMQMMIAQKIANKNISTVRK